MKINKKDFPKLIKLAKYVYPDYTGRKIYLLFQNIIDTNYNANWEGGSRTKYKFVRLDNGSMFVPPDIAPWKRVNSGNVELQTGLVCVTHSHFQGHDCGLTIYMNFNDQKQLESKI